MIEILIHHYLSLVISIGLGSLCVFFLSLSLFKKNATLTRKEEPVLHIPRPVAVKSTVISDISAIAGDDVIMTQLDLARAYIEINQEVAAKKILDDVKLKGNLAQQQEALRLMTAIK